MEVVDVLNLHLKSSPRNIAIRLLNIKIKLQSIPEVFQSTELCNGQTKDIP